MQQFWENCLSITFIQHSISCEGKHSEPHLWFRKLIFCGNFVLQNWHFCLLLGSKSCTKLNFKLHAVNMWLLQHQKQTNNASNLTEIVSSFLRLKVKRELLSIFVVVGNDIAFEDYYFVIVQWTSESVKLIP